MQYLGVVEVKQPRGSEVVRDAVQKLRVRQCSSVLSCIILFVHTLLQMVAQPSKLPEVDISISVRSIVVTEVKSKVIHSITSMKVAWLAG